MQDHGSSHKKNSTVKSQSLSLQIPGTNKVPPDRLVQLWGKLDRKEIFGKGEGPFAATHGKSHIENVLRNLNVIATWCIENSNRLNEHELDSTFLFAAGMIHDVGMLRTIAISDTETIMRYRLEHSRTDITSKLAKPLLIESGFNGAESDSIIAIASAHSDDDAETVQSKISRRKETLSLEDTTWFEACVRMLCLADYCDMGEDRLTKSPTYDEPHPSQTAHIDKHRFLECTVRNGVIYLRYNDSTNREFQSEVNLLSKHGGSLDENLETRAALYKSLGLKLQALHQAREDIENLLISLNEILGINWHLKLPNEKVFGRSFLTASGIGLFRRELRKTANLQTGPFPIDMMGHSLHGRFVADIENLNADLQDLLKTRPTIMRVLLLDPEFEGQQPCEIFESQSLCPTAEQGRKALPVIDCDGNMVEESDVHKTLSQLSGDKWIPGPGSRLDVRCTRRLLYSQISKFGDRMIVVHYRAKGLFNQSSTVVMTADSPLFHAYADEFDSVWNDPIETRTLLHRSGTPEATPNPIAEIVGLRCNGGHASRTSTFLYERSFLDHRLLIRQALTYAGLLNRPTESVKPKNRFSRGTARVRPKLLKLIPPYEVEIQPSSTCNLQCGHCIGKFVALNGIESFHLKDVDIRYMKSIFDWTENNQKVERIRISGLSGDPLNCNSIAFTIALIKLAARHQRRIVLFTNGVGLTKQDVRDAVRLVDDLHISLDAGTSKTFLKIKSKECCGHEGTFDQIVASIKELASGTAGSGHRPRLVIGFVVTQDNFEDIPRFLDLARACGVHHVRFKRAIHSPNAVSWGTWLKSVKTIADCTQLNDGLPEAIVTNVQRQHWNVPKDRCWAQGFCVVVGPDAKVYPCDHLTSSNCEFGNLRKKSFRDILTDAVNRQSLGSIGAWCKQCPPYNQRINQFMADIAAIAENYKWPQTESWIKNAARCESYSASS